MKNERFAWELFKTTGNIDAYMLMKEVEQSEELSNINNAVVDFNGNNKNQGDSYKNC